MTLALQSLTVMSRTGAPLFAPLSLSIAGGEGLTVMGPSGAGKSTLLDAIGGHLGRDFMMQGGVFLHGEDITPLPAERRGIGLMFLDALLFPHLSVGDNLAFGLPAGIRGRNARRERVETALEQAGLAGFAHRDPATLSGGQRARAALMRTLIAAPRALLLDEPFSKLDPTLRDEIRHFTFAHVRAAGVPTLLVTHDAQDAQAAGGAHLMLNGQ
jgi:putative thiamine transport system ATP-binding protein